MGELRIIGKQSTIMAGDRVEEDVKITWRKDNIKEIALAEKTFKEYLRKGWLAIGETSGKKTQIFTFDPNFKKIILAPYVMGG